MKISYRDNNQMAILSHQHTDFIPRGCSQCLSRDVPLPSHQTSHPPFPSPTQGVITLWPFKPLNNIHMVNLLYAEIPPLARLQCQPGGISFPLRLFIHIFYKQRAKQLRQQNKHTNDIFSPVIMDPSKTWKKCSVCCFVISLNYNSLKYNFCSPNHIAVTLWTVLYLDSFFFSYTTIILWSCLNNT